MISLIVAYDKNRCIGSKNTIPWKLNADMKRVKTLTTGQTILMGRTTFEGIGRPLPNRINRILTRNENFNYEGIEIVKNKEEALANIATDKLFIFGGSKVYKEFINYVEEMFITEVVAEVAGDSYFPEIDLSEWELVSEESFKKDDKNEYDYNFFHYIKKHR